MPKYAKGMFVKNGNGSYRKILGESDGLFFISDSWFAVSRDVLEQEKQRGGYFFTQAYLDAYYTIVTELEATGKEAEKWLPQAQERYYFIDADGKILSTTHDNHDIDFFRIKYGNCYPSSEAAKAALDEINAREV